MKPRLFVRALFLATLSLALGRAAHAEAWSFAVSGDSRDCGDLIMPKIAQAVAAEEAPGIDFYWHLGDFRRMYDVDCDILKRDHPEADCKTFGLNGLGPLEMSDYLDLAWKDAIDRQLRPFGKTPVLVGIGNHELMGRSRDDFRRAFQPYLVQQGLHAQRLKDARHDIYTFEGDTSYHLVRKGVALIYLDNADEAAFTPAQITWLRKVLDEDAKDDRIKTIVVGMHATLPYSVSRNHGMDASCQGLCSGQQAYDLLYRAQNLAGPSGKQRKVYVVSSHSHRYAANVYETPEHRGQVLPGWIVGTAGAQQYKENGAIIYGYVRFDVAEDGTVTPRFREVTRSSPPDAADLGSASLSEFCFSLNSGDVWDDAYKGDCTCGSVVK